MPFFREKVGLGPHLFGVHEIGCPRGMDGKGLVQTWGRGEKRNRYHMRALLQFLRHTYKKNLSCDVTASQFIQMPWGSPTPKYDYKISSKTPLES